MSEPSPTQAGASGPSQYQAIIDQGVQPDSTPQQQIAAHHALAQLIRSTSLVEAQAKANDLYTRLQQLDPTIPATDPAQAQAAANAWAAANAQVTALTKAADNADDMARQVQALLIQQAGKVPTEEEKAASVAATNLAKAQTGQIAHTITLENEAANLAAAQAVYDRDPSNADSKVAVAKANEAYQAALGKQAASISELNSANAKAQGLQNEILAATGLDAAKWGLKQAEANVADTQAGTAATAAETNKLNSMLPWDIAVQKANSESLALRNENDRRTLDAGGAEATVANTQSLTATNLANAAKTTLETQQTAEGARITQLRQIAEAIAKGTLDPADAFDLYTDARTQSTAFDRDKQATLAGQNFYDSNLRAGTFMPTGGADPGGAIGQMLGKLGGFAPDAAAFQPMRYGDLAAQSGVNITRNVPVASSMPQTATGLPPVANGYAHGAPVDMPPQQLEALLLGARQQAAAATANMQPTVAAAQSTPLTPEQQAQFQAQAEQAMMNPAGGQNQTDIWDAGRGPGSFQQIPAGPPGKPLPPPPNFNALPPIIPVQRAMGGTDLMMHLPPIAQGYRPVWRQ